jgi:hypothetical protein
VVLGTSATAPGSLVLSWKPRPTVVVVLLLQRHTSAGWVTVDPKGVRIAIGAAPSHTWTGQIAGRYRVLLTVPSDPKATVVSNQIGLR